MVAFRQLAIGNWDLFENGGLFFENWRYFGAFRLLFGVSAEMQKDP